MNGARILLVIAMAVPVLAANMAHADDLPRPSVYGLYAWCSGYVQYAEDIQRTGIRWVRVGGWLDRQTDEAALLAAANGVHLTPTLFLRDLSHDRTMPIDEALVQWRQHVRRSVERYGPGGTLWKEHPDAPALPIRYWEIWNEPNIEFLTPPEGMTRAELYARLLKAASEEIRALDPGAQIVAFNVAGGTPKSSPPVDGIWQRLKYFGWRRFIREVTEAAGTDCYDCFGTHPYTRPLGPEKGGVIEGLEMLAELAAEQGTKDKTVWFTEVGFPTIYPRNQQVKDEREQACFLVRLFAVAAAHNVAQVQVMFVADITYGPDGSTRAFGFFTAPGQWRPQAEATRVMMRLLPEPRDGAEVLSEEADGVFAYRFRGADGRPVIMAWTCGEEPVERAFDVDGDAVTIVDYLGGVREATVQNGQVRVELSDAPVYLVAAPAARVREVLGGSE